MFSPPMAEIVDFFKNDFLLLAEWKVENDFSKIFSFFCAFLAIIGVVSV